MWSLMTRGDAQKPQLDGRTPVHGPPGNSRRKIPYAMNSQIENYNFAVDLHGIVDLLSNHLYSNRDVFVREVLQNAVDAISARRFVDTGFQGEMRIELIGSGPGAGSALSTHLTFATAVSLSLSHHSRQPPFPEAFRNPLTALKPLRMTFVAVTT